jgi:hypothetical protein
MRLSENRTIAWIVFAVAVVFALSLSGNALEKNALDMRDDVLKVFYTGASGDGLCIDSDLKSRAKDAYTIIGIAKGYPAIDASLAQKATDAQKALDGANGLAQTEIKARSAANLALNQAIEDLYTAMNNAPLSDVDKRDARSVYDDFKSHGNTIDRDPYNELATQYNTDVKKMYSGFPAGLIGGIKGGAPALELFQ